MRVTSAKFNGAVTSTREALLEEKTPALAVVYGRVLRRYGRIAAYSYGQSAVTAAARPDELYDEDALAADVARESLRLRRTTVERMINDTLTSLSISFDLPPLLVDQLLGHIGIRARDLNASMRDSLRKTIEQAAAEGWTVPETAKAIGAGVRGMAGYTAEAMARTDLIGLANGGSHVAAREVFGDAATKQWLATPDDRTRPTHVDADGQEVPLDGEFEVGGETLAYPGDPSGSDEEVINCRCTVLYFEQAEDGITAAFSPGKLGAHDHRGDSSERVRTTGRVPGESREESVAAVRDGQARRESAARSQGRVGGVARADSRGEASASHVRDEALSERGAHVARDAVGSLEAAQAPGDALRDVRRSVLADQRERGRGVPPLRQGGVAAIQAAAERGPDVSDLAMVACYPSAEERSALAVEGGQEAETLHTTMVFLGEVGDVDLDAVRLAVAAVADDTAALQGRVGGVGLFAAGPDGHPQILLPNVGGLSELRVRLVDALAERGVESPSEHDWVPHMTIAYVEEPELPDLGVLGATLTYTTVALVVADTRENYDLGGAVSASATEEEGSMGEESVATVEITAGLPEIRVPLMYRGEQIGYARFDGDGVPEAAIVAAAAVAAAAEEQEEADAVPWVSDICFEGTATGDGRYIVPQSEARKLGYDGLTWRQPPLTLMAQTVTADGHDGAEVAGRMDLFFRDKELDMEGRALPTGVSAIRSTGVFTSKEFGEDISDLVGDETLRGISVDMSIREWTFRDPDTGELLDKDAMTEDDWDRAFFGELEFAMLEAEVMAATICPTPAFADARIAVVASADGTREYVATFHAPIRLLHPPTEAITAAAAGGAPLHPPAEWFAKPTFTQLTPVRITDEGRISGHFAPMASCLVGRAGCTPPPRGEDYGNFNTGYIVCDDGTEVSVGQITMDAPHADDLWSLEKSRKHYDNTGYAVADVHVGEDSFGPWMVGAVRPDLPETKLRALRASSPSGDWRPHQGRHRLLAILAVNVPGFPVPRDDRVAITASGVARLSAAAGGSPDRLAALAARFEREPIAG